MAADATRLLIKRHIMAPVQKPGRREARYA